MATHQEKFEKDLSTLKKYLQGARYHHAILALSFAEQYHPGFRKDGITPNFHHQVRIALTLFNERSRLEAAGLSVDEIIAAGILHDTYEDNQSLQLALVENKFNARIVKIMTTLSKVRDGVHISTDDYYQGLLACPEALIIKLHDRRDNVQTIAELAPPKQIDYVFETEKLIEITKKALDRYPHLTELIQDFRMRLKSYVAIYKACVNMFQSEKGPEVLALFATAGLLSAPNAPQPSSPHGQLPRPKGP